MSVAITVTGVGVPAGEVEAAAAAGQRLAEDWEQRFSRFRPDSVLSRLNAAGGRPVAVDAEFVDVLTEAAAAVARTNGRFDPSILPALVAAGYDRSIEAVRAAPAPLRSPDAPTRPAGPAGWRLVEIDAARGRVRLPPGMRIDLGGIAKGAFIDRLAARFADWPGGCVNAGGDLRVWGLPPAGEAWLVGVEDPLAPERDLLVAAVRHPSAAGVATSATNRRRWGTGGQSAHHLIDPRTGRPLAGPVIAATAFAPSAVQAEVATKFLLVGAAEGAPLDPVEAALAIVVDAAGRPHVIPGFAPDACALTALPPDRRSA